MESMESISAQYTTAYPEIHPDSAYGSTEAEENPSTPVSALSYNEDLMHKVGSFGFASCNNSTVDVLKKIIN